MSGYAEKVVVDRKRELVQILARHLPEFLGGCGGRAVSRPGYDEDFARDLIDTFKTEDRRAAWFLLALRGMQSQDPLADELLGGIDWNEGVFVDFTCGGGSDMLDGLKARPQWSLKNCYEIKRGGISAFMLNVMNSGRRCRNNSEKDVQALQRLFQDMGAELTLGNKYTAQGILEELMAFKKGVCAGDPSCTIICLMSHGNKKSILGDDEKELNLQKVFDEFSAGNCQALWNKPKMFIIQACRGDEHDNVETDSAQPVKFRPQKYADMLKVFSSPEDQFSYRNGRGSVLIQEIVSIFREHMKSMHVMDMLTKVTKNVGDQVFKYEGAHVKVVPVVETTLTKELYLCETA